MAGRLVPKKQGLSTKTTQSPPALPREAFPCFGNHRLVAGDLSAPADVLPKTELGARWRRILCKMHTRVGEHGPGMNHPSGW